MTLSSDLITFGAVTLANSEMESDAQVLHHEQFLEIVIT